MSTLPEEMPRDENLQSESFYSLRLKEWSQQIRVIGLSAEWEKSILDLIPSRLKRQHPRRVKRTLKEIRDIYENDMRNCAVESIIPRSKEDDDEADEQEKRKRRIGELWMLRKNQVLLDTEQRSNVSKQRVLFGNKYFLSHSIMKHIIATARCTLPRVVINLKDYRNSGLFQMSELQDTLMSKIKRGKLTIKNDYYGEVVKFMTNYTKSVGNREKKKIGMLMNCATNLFAQQIVKMMMNTIDEFIEALIDYQHCCPQLNFQLVWNENCLSIEPSIEEVHSMWHRIFKGVERMADNLLPFDEAIMMMDSELNNETRSDNSIKIALPDWYIEKSHDEVGKIMENAVEPLEKYFEETVEQFGSVSSSEFKQNILDLVSKGRNFDVFCVNVKKLNGFYDKANDLVDHVHYDIGSLNEILAKKGLKAHIGEMRDMLVEKLLLHHKSYNEEICREFQTLHDQMLDIPNNAKALFELSETTSYASKILVDKLEKRIKQSIEMLSSLLQITGDMTDKHMELNSRTINWLTVIKPIFTKSNILCEAMKSELEDELQRRINNLNVDIEAVIPHFVILDDMDDGSRVEDYVEHLKTLVGHLEKLDQQINRINFEEKLFKFPETGFPNVEEIREIITPVYTLNNLMCRWRRDHSVWLDGPFEYINAQEVETKTLNYHDRFSQLNTSLKAKIKLDMQSAATKPFKYSGVVDDPDPMQQPAPLKLCYQILEDVENFKQYLELIVCMCNPALCERHWDEMSLIYDSSGENKITPNAGTTLRKLIALDLKTDISKYQVVSVGANKELALVRRLDEMTKKWETIDFTIKSSDLTSPGGRGRQERRSTFAHLHDIEILMEEHFVIIREMRVSYFVKPIASDLVKFSVSLDRVRDMIDEWLGLQDEWFDLEPVFRSGLPKDDIDTANDESLEQQQQLQTAMDVFLQVNDTLQDIKREIMDDPKFLPIANKSLKFLQLLQIAAEKIDIVKEIVRSYVQQIRSSYPRFYFLSDREAIKILFEPIFSKKMKLLLKKCFTGIRSIRLIETSNRITVVSIIDCHDEELSLTTVNRGIESNKSSLCSFTAIEKSINHAVRNNILQRTLKLNDQNSSTSQSPEPCHTILMNSTTVTAAICSWRIYWTCKMEKAFLTVNPCEELISHHEEQSYTLNEIMKKLKEKVSRQRRKTLICLIIEIRQKQDITKFVTEKIKSVGHRGPEDFNWKAQIRHYLEEDDVKVVILNTKVSYGYEFSACEKPSIDTPLTDRCYRSVMEAHRNRLYGSLFGPAATGKSQCIKNLAGTLGIYLRVFNCVDDLLNYNYIGNIFKGLLGCSPCWLCFKNLDLLSIEILSVIAQQISLMSGILSSSNVPRIIEFQGINLNVKDPNCCFINSTISMKNSTDSRRVFKYQNLPDSLKIFFRPIAMILPDARRIVEIELFAEGFISAAILAEKMYLVEKYSVDQLTSNVTKSTTGNGNLYRESSVTRYDFGMRTTNAVIKTTCALKNRYPDEPEDSLFLRALIDVYLPKLSHSDILTFHHIIEDIFPGVALPPPDYTNLLSAVEEIRRVKYKKSHIDSLYDLKIIQLFETLFMRHAIIVVGPTLAGKSSIIDNLGKTLSFLNSREKNVLPAVESVRINQNSFTSEELFGRYDEDSKKLCWKDGIATRTLRLFVEEEERNRHHHQHWQWLIFDGPLDSPFLDKLSTLLDDNKTLFLSSGESIRMTTSMSVIFETMSMNKASPGTISRCGIIYVEEGTISWRGQIRYWIAEERNLFPCPSEKDEKESNKYIRFLESLLEWSLSACLTFVYEKYDRTRNTAKLSTKNHMIISVLRHFSMFLRDALGESVETTEIDKEKNSSFEGARWNVSNFFIWSQAALLMAIIWGLGGSLDRDFRTGLDEFCSEIWNSKGNNESLESFPRPDAIKSFDFPLPSEGLIRDNIYLFNGTGNWRHWAEIIKKDGRGGDNCWSPHVGLINYVPTIESLSYMNLFQIHVKYKKPFLLMGETAIGKTLYMRHLLKTKLCQSTYSWNFLTLNSIRPTGCEAQKMFLSKLTKLKRGLYGSGKNRLCINFIDDLNAVPSADNIGGQAALELIRQYFNDSEWFDIDSGSKIRLSNIMFLGAVTLDRRNEWNDKWKEAPRFFSHFNLYNIERPSKESIFKIYSNTLLNNLKMNMFSADISGSVANMVNATIDVYSSILEKLRPIPSKFQYQFSLRDVDRVISGCSLIHKESVETKTTFIRLWVHEIFRVFADRITDNQESEWLFVKIKESAKARFKDTFESVFDHLPKNNKDKLTLKSFGQLYFSDFMQSDAIDNDAEIGQTTLSNDNSNSKRRYEEITCSRDVLKNKAISYLNRYNEESVVGQKLDIVIVPGMLEHLIRICRVIGILGGSLLMICFGGSGRKSLTALAAHIKAQHLQELSYPISSTLTIDSWKTDLKRACMNCAAAVTSTSSTLARDSTFFITDRQISGADPNLLVDICNLMKTGEIPGLFTDQERDMIIENSRLLAQNHDRNLEMRSLGVIDYFYNTCREKVHFVLYFDRAGMKNCSISGSSIFDSIVNHCFIDCYESWPEEAFVEIANKFIPDIEIDKDVRSKAVAASKYFYDSVDESWRGGRGSNSEETREQVTTKLPVAAYIHMLKLYRLTMTKKQSEIKASRRRYLNGLDKLQLAGEQVREMKAILTRLRPELELSAEETADTMKKIERENISVENATVQVKREEEVANRIAEVAGILKEECEADLAVAIPILEDAIAALNTLKPTDITLVKAMKNPPDTVKLVLAAVCVMLNIPPDRLVDPVTGKKSLDYWAPSKRILGDMNFLQNLKDYDKDNIAASVMAIINKTYMTDDNFMPHIVAKASSAAEGLCKWVRAMVSYDEVAKVVAPKKEKLATAEKECNASLEYLNEKRKSLAALYEKLAALNVVLEATLAKKLELENQVENCTRKLVKAEGLITSLAGEKDRWLKSEETLRQSYDCLAGDLLLSCGIVAFLGPFDANHRDKYLVQWKNRLRELHIRNSDDSYDFVNSLETELQINTWQQFGLSKNSFSHGNAAIMINTLLCPLFIDPQNQANLWIKRMESSNKFKVIKATDMNWLREIQASIEEGFSVLVENLDKSEYLETTDLDHILSHLLSRRDYKSSGMDGESKETEESPSAPKRLNTNIQIYMTSRVSLPESSFQRHLYKRMTVINFSLSDEALEHRLLEIVVSRERPELQDAFDKLALESTSNKQVLKQEENKILAILSGSSVNIIEDERAIQTLDYSKNLSLEIMRKEESAKATNRDMTEFRSTYRSFTEYCATLYDTLTSLANLNHMYRFSLDWFTRLYVRSIDNSMKSVLLDKRLKYLKKSFTETLHVSVRNALLDEHKLLYSFLLSVKTLLDSKKITQEEIRLFRDSIQFSVENPEIASARSPSIKIAERLNDSLPEVFQQLPDSFDTDASSWRDFCCKNSLNRCENKLPVPWNEKLSNFQQLILVNSIKPEETLGKIMQLVDNTLETKLNSISRYSIARSFEESSCLIPLIFILPNYLEASVVIDKWAKTMGYSSKLVRFSMGADGISEGSAAFASDIDQSIERARKHGSWILLENCHLATDSLLSKLERICECLDPSNTALSFRLWLTSYPSHRFPISILQNSIKIHWEAPSDRLKESLLLSYQSEPLDDPDFYDSCPGKNKVFSKLIYSLCFFHAIVRGREKFGKRAWNVPSYEFSNSDLTMSIRQLQMFLNETIDQVPTSFEALNYLIGECYYGGRILDPIDRNCLDTILSDYCNPGITRATLNYVFAISPDGLKYFVPNRTEYRDYIKHINDFIPIGDTPPQIFGLDDNAAIIKNCRSSIDFIKSLSLIFVDNPMKRNFHDSDLTADRRKAMLLDSIIQDIRSKLLENGNDDLLDVTSAKKKYPVLYAEPLNALFIEEIELYNKLIETILDSLVDVERTHNDGLAPFLLTSTKIDQLTRDLIDSRVPLEWIGISNENKQTGNQEREQSLSRFIDYLPKRKHFLNNWINNSHEKNYSIWLGGLVGCKKFISATRLMFARQSGIPLSHLTIDYEILKTEIAKSWEFIDIDEVTQTGSKPEEFKVTAMHIHGLFLSGARWDIERSTLVESLPKLYWHSMPIVRLNPRLNLDKIEKIDDDLKEKLSSKYYLCPVNASTKSNADFLDSLPSNYVTTLPLHTIDVPPEYWIKRATALFCNNDV